MKAVVGNLADFSRRYEPGVREALDAVADRAQERFVLGITDAQSRELRALLQEKGSVPLELVLASTGETVAVVPAEAGALTAPGTAGGAA